MVHHVYVVLPHFTARLLQVVLKREREIQAFGVARFERQKSVDLIEWHERIDAVGLLGIALFHQPRTFERDLAWRALAREDQGLLRQAVHHEYRPGNIDS